MRYLIFFLLFSSFSNAFSYVKHSDIQYRHLDGVDKNLLSLDIYVPDNITEALPVMVYVHGGSWKSGDKANVGSKAGLFTSEGFIFISINYRLSPNPADTSNKDRVQFPDHPEDCAKAVRWVYDNIGGYGGDKTKINLIGHSAGAHLVSLLATNDKFLLDNGLELSDLEKVCSLDFGAFNLPKRISQLPFPGDVELLNAFGLDSAQWIEASPALNVDESKDIPPIMLVFQGIAKNIEMNSEFADTLMANSKKVDMFNAFPYGHSTINAALGHELDSIGLTKAVIEFFRTGIIPDIKTIFNLAYAHDEPLGQSTTILDANEDGLPDIVSASKGQIHYIRNLGNMEFRHEKSETADNANGFGMYDFNSDGRMDFMIAQSQQLSVDNPDIRINNGNFEFSSDRMGNESIGPVRNIVLADFDLDGIVDSFHSASAFGNRHEGNQFHPGINNSQFGPDIIEEILNPGIENFWYGDVIHPERGPEKWSNIQSKGAFARDFDGDGKPEIVFCAYTDLGFQEDDFAREWILKQKRGIFLLQNNSEPGDFSFMDVSHEALGSQAYGTTEDIWEVYFAVPFDYDLDGDFDLYVGANIVRGKDTDQNRFFENVSVPGNIKFIDKTDEAGFGFFNRQDPETKSNRNFASGIPIDFDNDGWIDLAVANRKSVGRTNTPYTYLFRNNGDKTFSFVKFNEHGLGEVAGGRDINYADFDLDGNLDIVLSDGTVGGYYGSDSTLIYHNLSENSNNWIQLDIRFKNSWAFGSKVKIFGNGTSKIAGFDVLRTDFAYRSKRMPLMHFGLGNIESIDVEVTDLSGNKYYFEGLEANQNYLLQLNPELSIQPARINSFKVSPNPASGNFKVSANYSGELSVFDVFGKLALKDEIKGQFFANRIECDELEPGIYFITINGFTQKLIITR